MRVLFVAEIKHDSLRKQPRLLPRDEYKKLAVFLNNAEHLVTLNANFFEDLVKRKDACGEVLRQYVPLFRMYGQYAASYKAGLEVIVRCKDKYPGFRDFLQRKEALAVQELAKAAEAAKKAEEQQKKNETAADAASP